MSPLISAAALRERLDAPGALVLDASYYLPNEG